MLSYKEIQEIEKKEKEIERLKYEQDQLRSLVVGDNYDSKKYRSDGDFSYDKSTSIKIENKQKYQQLATEISCLQKAIDYIKGKETRETLKEQRLDEDRRKAYCEAYKRYVEQSVFKKAAQILTGKSFKSTAKKDNLSTDEIKGLYK